MWNQGWGDVENVWTLEWGDVEMRYRRSAKGKLRGGGERAIVFAVCEKQGEALQQALETAEGGGDTTRVHTLYYRTRWMLAAVMILPLLLLGEGRNTEAIRVNARHSALFPRPRGMKHTTSSSLDLPSSPILLRSCLSHLLWIPIPLEPTLVPPPPPRPPTR